ncbi:MAG: hypothetical protein JKY69_03630 [Flavobacteriaceae bacterium]|nr:hypothetical protein [Flavobacteriaceae bacterium]
MHEQIRRVLRKTPGIKAKEIAKKIGSDKKSVNIFLYANDDYFVKDSNHCWTLVAKELVVKFVPSWIDCNIFEDCLSKKGALLDSSCDLITFIFPNKCKLMFDVLARLLALCNQLILDGKKVCLDFCKNKDTLTYIDRVGFLEHLHQDVEFLPQRPFESRSNAYRGNSDALVEIGFIDPMGNNEELIKSLTDCFVTQSSIEYDTVAFTIFSELIGNVKEHSSSVVKGFSGLQKYDGSNKHIQTVISDSGIGIFNSLKDAIPDNYPDLNIFKDEDDFDIRVVETVLINGEISRKGKDKGRGLGFKSSSAQAKKFDATLSIRQENFSLVIRFRNGRRLPTIRKTELVRINGTHLCFDFLVD